jgi:hypothetical protein
MRLGQAGERLGVLVDLVGIGGVGVQPASQRMPCARRIRCQHPADGSVACRALQPEHIGHPDRPTPHGG